MQRFAANARPSKAALIGGSFPQCEMSLLALSDCPASRYRGR
jgi:hypothetical protein